MEPNPERQLEAAKAELQRVMKTFGLTRDDVVTLVGELPVDATAQQPEVSESMQPSPVPEGRIEDTLHSLSSDIAGELQNGQTSTALEPLKRELEQQGLKRLGEAIEGSVRWLGEKLELFRGLTEEEAGFKIKVGWSRMVDYLITVDAAADLQGYIPEDRTSAILSALSPLVDAMRHRQLLLQTTLQAKGITQMNAQPGSRPIYGVVEWSMDEPIPTNDPRLHNTVAFVTPGNHGFRHRGKILVWTSAHHYEYHP